MKPSPSQLKGFTLVELSIVIVIIGLIVAGVTAGRSLIKSAQLQSVISQSNQIKTAIGAFKLQYDYLPGDMPNAYSYWGASAGCTNAMQTDVGCNGNGDKRIRWSNGVGSFMEGLLIWMHLSQAKLISGSYNGLSTYAGNGATAGVNVPPGPLPNSGWWASNTYSEYAMPGYPATLKPSSMIGIGTYFVNNAYVGSLFAPAEAASIDSKIDDGLPQTGIAFAGGGCGGSWVCSTNCNTGNTYKATVKTQECYMGFLLPY